MARRQLVVVAAKKGGGGKKGGGQKKGPGSLMSPPKPAEPWLQVRQRRVAASLCAWSVPRALLLSAGVGAGYDGS